MAQNKQRGNIRQYRRPLNVNIGLIIFSIIFVYIIVCVFLYATSKHIVGYEVRMGTLSINNIYKGVVIREEKVVTSEASGYVNYYAREGERVGVGNLVYSVDESGKLSELVNKGDLGENPLTDSDLTELKTEMTNFFKNFDSDQFSSVYDFKYEVKGTVLKLANVNVLESIDTLSQGSAGELVDLCRAPETGIVVYNTDGLEALTAETVSKELFEEEAYSKKQLISNELTATGDPVYKLVTDENWSIVIPIDEERAADLTEAEFVQVRFLKNQMESWAETEVYTVGEDYYAKLKLNNSMISFCTERFLDIELITEEESGLKIPNTSIIEREFYLIPKAYAILGGEGGKDGFMREVYAEDGTLTTGFVEATIYAETDEEFYVDESVFRIGEYLLKPDSTEKYPISKKGTLIGVYSMDKGYADFKQISVLYKNDEYSIVKSNTHYGLNVYDHIVLDALAVDEDEFIYE